MERGSKKVIKLSDQIKKKIAAPKIKQRKTYDGDMKVTISTGSTLLDLAISGGRKRGGGLPGGIMMEVFGPSGSGKTVMLSEIAGAIQRKGGEITFHDPEARLNKSFASMFDLDIDKMNYETPNTVKELFLHLNKWEPKHKGINGVITDSLAALSTEIEMGNDDGDKMGMKRAKDFSEGFRKAARLLAKNNHLMVCSNQVRDNHDAGPYGVKFVSPGGQAIGFYASVRLRTFNPKKIKKKIKVAGKEVERVIGVQTQIEIFKNSVWSPYRKVPVRIIFDYGIDDIAENLQYIKDYTSNTTYTVDGAPVGKSLAEACSFVEEYDLEFDLQEEVIDLWESIESKLSDSSRKIKKR